jgi:hypothetical protein
VKLQLVAGAADAALAGADGRGPGSGPVVALGEAPLPTGVEPGLAVRWLRGAARPAADALRVIAQIGQPVWRLAPWPAADALFELPPAPDASALVVAGHKEAEELLESLMARGLDIGVAKRLTLERLESASVVLFPTRAGEPLPAEAPAVLAARRVLVTGPCQPTFGLIPEVDWFPAEHPNEIAQYADSAMRHPSAFRTPRAMGALAAERHRASLVYERLSIDLELEGVLSG